jgi:hypothetical protein
MSDEPQRPPGVPKWRTKPRQGWKPPIEVPITPLSPEAYQQMLLDVLPKERPIKRWGRLIRDTQSNRPPPKRDWRRLVE